MLELCAAIVVSWGCRYVRRKYYQLSVTRVTDELKEITQRSSLRLLILELLEHEN
jgi:hypothetical protein